MDSLDSKRDSLGGHMAKKKTPTIWTAVGVGLATLGGGLLGWMHRRRQVALEKRTIDLSAPIQALEVGSGFDVELGFGLTVGLVMEGQPTILDEVNYTLHEGLLRVYLSPDGLPPESSRRVTLYLSLPSLPSITLLSDSSLSAQGVNEVEHFTLVQHSSRLKGLQVEGEVASIRLSGEFKSSGHFRSKSLSVQTVGNGRLKYDALTSETNLSMAGSGLAYLSGLADRVDCSQSGRTKVHAEKFVAESIKVLLSHDAQAEWKVNQTYLVSLSERSHLILRGEGAKPSEVTVTQQAKFIRCK